MNWYLQSGKESDVVVSSRIRLARNIIEYPFETRCSKKENEEIVNKIKEVLPSIGYVTFISVSCLTGWSQSP